MQREQRRNAGSRAGKQTAGDQRCLSAPGPETRRRAAASGRSGSGPVTAGPMETGPPPPRPARRSAPKRRGLKPWAGDLQVRAVRRRVATGLLRQKAVRSHSIPVWCRSSFGVPDASPAHLAPFFLSGDPLSFYTLPAKTPLLCCPWVQSITLCCSLLPSSNGFDLGSLLALCSSAAEHLTLRALHAILSCGLCFLPACRLAGSVVFCCHSTVFSSLCALKI